jgi:hypothetical protein
MLYVPRAVVFVTSAFRHTMFCLILTKKTDCVSIKSFRRLVFVMHTGGVAVSDKL